MVARRSKGGYIGIKEEEEEEEGRKRKREAEIVRAFRVRNRFPRVKPSSLSQRNSLEALLCVRASTPVAARRFLVALVRCWPRREKRDVRLSLLGKLGKKLELVGTCP